jgi:hypothetical protein
MRLKDIWQTERDFLITHVLFAIISVFVLILPCSVPPGWRLFLLVVIYNIGVPAVAIIKNYSEWLTIWQFAFALSIFQVFPDWFLASQLNVLVFPEDGFFKIGAVSAYMAGLWAIPIFVIVYIGKWVEKHLSLSLAYTTAGLASLFIFGASEQTMWQLNSWYAHNINLMIGHTALYVIPAEILLGVSAFYAYRITCSCSLWQKVAAAFFVMTFYIGNLAFFYFIFENMISQ